MKARFIRGFTCLHVPPFDAVIARPRIHNGRVVEVDSDGGDVQGVSFLDSFGA